MTREIVRLAARDGTPRQIPNIRYVGVGPDPDQVIADIPPTDRLIAEA